MTTKTKVQKTTKETARVTSNTTAQPQLQESAEAKKNLLSDVQQNFIAQSQTFSNVTRTIAGVILGTIWIICYKEDKVEIPNFYVLASIIISFVFFLIELAHYYTDSVFYHETSDKMVESKGDFDYKEKYEEVQNRGKISFCFLRAKAVIVSILSIVFIIGIIQIYLSNHYFEMSLFPEIYHETIKQLTSIYN